MKTKRPGTESFSLVEAILAMTILGITVTAILTNFSASLVGSRAAEDYARTSMMMQELKTYVRGDLFSPMQVNQGTFTNQPGFEWQVTYNTTEYPNLYQVVMQIRWQRGGSMKTAEYVTYHYFDTMAAMEQTTPQEESGP